MNRNSNLAGNPRIRTDGDKGVRVPGAGTGAHDQGDFPRDAFSRFHDLASAIVQVPKEEIEEEYRER